MAPRRQIACRIIGTLVCLLIASIAAAAPPEGKPVLVPVWKKTTIGLPPEEDFNWDRNKPAKEWLTTRYQTVIKDAHERSRPIIPPATPVATKGLVVYTNDEGLLARFVSTQVVADEKYQAGDLFWLQERNLGLFQMAQQLGGQLQLQQWLKGENAAALSDRIMHRTLCHSFQITGGSAFYIDDIGLLPRLWNKDQALIEHNGLFSLALRRTLLPEVNLESGKLKIRAGQSDDSLLTTEVYFLSQPVYEEPTLQIIKEQDGIIRLLCLDWKKHNEAFWKHWTKKGGTDRALDEARTWEVELAKPPIAISQDRHRRPHAIQLLRSSELVFAPTNLGRIVAVEEKTGKIIWTHEYAPLDAKRFPTFAPEWVVVPPVVVGDKYIYAPADFAELLCLNVADGKKVWSVKKGDGLYPAVVDEQVLVIGEKTLRSLSLKDGSEQWKIDLPGLPCGRGAVLGDTYLLPISEPKTWRGMVAIIDLKTQKIREVLKPDKDEPIGNLVVHQDMLISQTLTEIAVYPIRK